MSADPLVLMGEVEAATSRLLATAGTLDGDPTAPSLLPGWSRGHVLTHVARNADGLANLLTWAHTGVVTPQYADREQRDAEINAGARRSWDELIADIRQSAERFARVAEQLTPADWAVHLETAPGQRSEAALIPWRRLREVEVHHVDLAASYRPADWPESFAHRVLHEVAGSLEDVSLTVRPDSLGHAIPVGDGGPPEVRGPAHELAAWLAGRSPGTGLKIDPPGALPTIPSWR
jgi:maleylpyruvate isomerase